MITFLRDCQYAFAACAVLGIIPAAVLAAKARSLPATVLAVAVAGFVVFVCVATGVRLR